MFVGDWLIDDAKKSGKPEESNQYTVITIFVPSIQIFDICSAMVGKF